MIEAPECLLCGERHWSDCPNSAWKTTGPRSLGMVPLKPGNPYAQPSAEIIKLPRKKRGGRHR